VTLSEEEKKEIVNSLAKCETSYTGLEKDMKRYTSGIKTLEFMVDDAGISTQKPAADNGTDGK
jgi:hypothetical protein